MHSVCYIENRKKLKTKNPFSRLPQVFGGEIMMLSPRAKGYYFEYFTNGQYNLLKKMDGGCKIKKETKHACKMFGLNNGKVGIAFPGKEKV